jgi:flagellar biosynthesis/type III secretory pathway protein FliH
VQLFARVDTKTLVGAYAAHYPLFQQAYRELGYPQGYFNDRLVATIDSLLATPDVPGPIAVVQPKVMFEYARPELEALPAGQKIMLRVGPENARTVKAKLREVRQALTGITK